MKPLNLITLIIVIFMILFALRWAWETWKKGRRTSPNDILHDLNFKIMYTPVNDHNELYLIRQIKELRIRKDVDQKQLDTLDRKFRERFSELHETDEFSPENIEFEESLKYIQSKKEFEDDYILPDMN